MKLSDIKNWSEAAPARNMHQITRNKIIDAISQLEVEVDEEELLNILCKIIPATTFEEAEKVAKKIAASLPKFLVVRRKA